MCVETSTPQQGGFTSSLGPEAQGSHRHLCGGMQSICQHPSSPVNWAHWPPGALSPSLPGSLGPQVLKKLERNNTDKSGRAVSHRTFLLPPPRCLNPTSQAIPRSGKPTFPTKSFHASSKPTVTPVPSGLLSTIIFSYFIFQVDRRFLDG